MRFCLALLIPVLCLAGCTGCEPGRPDVTVGVGVGASGTHSDLSLGQSCGGMQVRVGTGGMMGLGAQL